MLPVTKVRLAPGVNLSFSSCALHVVQTIFILSMNFNDLNDSFHFLMVLILVAFFRHFCQHKARIKIFFFIGISLLTQWKHRNVVSCLRKELLLNYFYSCQSFNIFFGFFFLLFVCFFGVFFFFFFF